MFTLGFWGCDPLLHSFKKELSQSLIKIDRPKSLDYTRFTQENTGFTEIKSQYEQNK